MFEKLVESSGKRSGRRAGRYFALTTLIYAVALTGLVIGAIVGFSPALAEDHVLEVVLTPPPPPAGPPPAPIVQNMTRVASAANIFVPPTRPPEHILPASEVDKYPMPVLRPAVPGAPPGDGLGDGSVAGGRDVAEYVPPPPTPPPAELTPTPVVERNPRKVSEGVLQGSAVKKVKPSYPVIARNIRVSGPVQVLVVISEEGRVMEAAALSGHPMLRSAAVEAARQWLFAPTTLNKTPVKVQGVLTFNFVIE